MIKANVLNTLYERKGIGNRTFSVTCTKENQGYSLCCEKKIKIRSKNKISDPKKSTSRKTIFSISIKINDLNEIDYYRFFSSLSNEEKEIFHKLVIKIAEKINHD